MRPILAAVDMSRTASVVVNRAAEIASLIRGDLTILSVVGSDPTRISTIAEEKERAIKFHRELIYKLFPSKAVTVESKSSDSSVYRYNPSGLRITSKVLSGSTVDMICNYADEIKADMVVVGNRGLGNAGMLVLGSVSEKVVTKSSRTVLVVKGGSSENSDWEAITGSQSGQYGIGTG